MFRKETSMSIPSPVVVAARKSWQWQWQQLMNGLAPADKDGNYCRPKSEHLKAKIPSKESLANRSSQDLPHLIIGRSCPWAHRTWLIYQLRSLKNSLNLRIADVDQNGGRWTLNPPWLGCNSLLSLYKLCGAPPNHRATVPVIIDPVASNNSYPIILGNESAQLVEVLNEWPTNNNAPDLEPIELKEEIANWQKLIQPYINDGVYRCGFARNQSAYNKACTELFDALKEVNQSLSKKGPWLCGEKLTIADIRLFPTLIRWEMIYMPLFGCSKEPIWAYKYICEWRKKLLAIPSVIETCDSKSWRNDYFGALFPLRPSNIVPDGPDLIEMVASQFPHVND